MKRIGSIGVDSGQVMIVDPCYVYEDEFCPDGTPTGGKYDTTCRITLNGDHYGDNGDGFVTATPHGDGLYPVYGEFDGDTLVYIMIDLSNSGWLDDEEG